MSSPQVLEEKYQNLKDQLLEDTGSVFGHCHLYARVFVEYFPELRYAHGEIFDHIWGKRAHGWCVNIRTGEIIDPTREQFPAPCDFNEYRELSPQELPLGKCLNCGELIYSEDKPLSDRFCSSQCTTSFLATLL